MFGAEGLRTWSHAVVAVPSLFASSFLECCLQVENFGFEQGSFSLPQLALPFEQLSFLLEDFPLPLKVEPLGL